MKRKGNKQSDLNVFEDLSHFSRNLNRTRRLGGAKGVSNDNRDAAGYMEIWGCGTKVECSFVDSQQPDNMSRSNYHQQPV